MNRRLALSIMVLCLLLAAALRLPELASTPPGLHYDEAANGVLASEIGLRGERPVFIASYTGKEVLFFYLAAAVMQVAGDSVFALRLTAAFLGLLTVAATYWLGRMLLADRRVALLAAALLAVSFWHVLFSRLGFRAISQPLLQALVVGALFAGVRQPNWRRSWPWLLLAGVALGLTAYTYLAARFFPIALLLGLLPLLFGSESVRLRLKQLALFFIVGFVALAPLALYFANNPDTFWVRAGQVLPEGSRLPALLESYGRSLAALFLDGDPYWRFNIPGRPLFYPLWAVLLIAGWLYAALRWFKQPVDWRRSAYLLLAVMPLVMVLPEALAIGEIVPSNLRAVGLLPFIYILPALGFLLLVRIAGRIWRAVPFAGGRVRLAISGLASKRPALWAFSAIMILLVGGATTGRAYFEDWATRADVFYESDGDLVAVSDYLDTADLAGKSAYVAALHYRHPTMAFLSEGYDQLKWLPEGQALVFRSDEPALYIYPHNSPPPEWATRFLPAEPAVEGPAGPDGRPTFLAYELTGLPELAPAYMVNANFTDQVTLVGYEIGQPDSGETLSLTLYWRVQRPPAGNLMPFVHLEDAWGYRWGQVESIAYPADQWQPDDIVVQQVEAPLRSGMPPGYYDLRVGIFDADNGQPLPLLDEGGRYAGNALTIEDVSIFPTWPVEDLPMPGNVLDMQVNPNLRLLGYERAEQRVTAGAPFWLSLWWAADGPLQPMSTRLSLIGANNSGRIVLDTPPARGTFPFETWTTPTFVIDHMTPRVPVDLPPGDYIVAMRLLDGGDQGVLEADLGPLTVEPSNRLFDPPRTQFPLRATFGGEIELLGYDLRSVEPGKAELSLVWQAASEPADSYTVFVHVLDPEGVCCAWQKDMIPGQGAQPTDQWLAGEVVVDNYLIEMPQDAAAGAYPIEVGLYRPQNGQRLLVTIPGLRDNDVLYLRPIEME
jgi:4-amino-4-deoxy-L-arabinose transferase-like glycosyltransferase